MSFNFMSTPESIADVIDVTFEILLWRSGFTEQFSLDFQVSAGFLLLFCCSIELFLHLHWLRQ